MAYPYRLITILFLLTTAASAQPDRGQRFAAAAYLGANAAQIDGDYYFGYNHLGLNAGIESQLLLSPKYFVSVGLSFSQMGAKPTRREISERGGRVLQLRLNSVEIPLMFNYRLGKKNEFTKKKDYRLFKSAVVRAGVSLSRLTGYRTTDFGDLSALPRNQNFVSVEDEFNQFDLYALVGVTIPVNMHWSFYLHHTKSIFGLYQPDGGFMRNAVLPLFPYSLSLGVRYTVY